jgi:hypothetical protein
MKKACETCGWYSIDECVYKGPGDVEKFLNLIYYFENLLNEKLKTGAFKFSVDSEFIAKNCPFYQEGVENDYRDNRFFDTGIS